MGRHFLFQILYCFLQKEGLAVFGVLKNKYKDDFQEY
jgi:hypothetical protein